MKRILAFTLIALFGLTSLAFAQSRPVTRGTLNSSAVISAGNSFQTVLSAVASGGNARQSLTIENNNASDSCWLFIGAGSPTKGTSILLGPGGSYQRYAPYIPSDPIQATCATTNDTLYIDTQ